MKKIIALLIPCILICFASINAFATTDLGVIFTRYQPLEFIGFGISNIDAATDGNKIFVMGGFGSLLGSLDTNIVYDIGNDKWTIPSPYAEMTERRHDAATIYRNAKVYVIGGKSHNKAEIKNSNEVYDIASDTWTTLMPLPMALEDAHGGEYNNKIYICGGNSASGVSKKLYEYDIAINSWEEKASMNYAREAHMTAMYDGKLYVFGGRGDSNASSTVEVYDRQTDTWTVISNLPTPRWHGQAVVLNDYIYVLGGTNNPTWRDNPDYDGVNVIEVFDPRTNKWLIDSSFTLPKTLDRFAIARTAGNEAFIIGGFHAVDHYSGDEHTIIESLSKDVYMIRSLIRSPYDVNGDSIVNTDDLEAMKYYYGSKEGDDNYDEKYDYNQDGRIDIFDQVQISRHIFSF